MKIGENWKSKKDVLEVEICIIQKPNEKVYGHANEPPVVLDDYLLTLKVTKSSSKSKYTLQVGYMFFMFGKEFLNGFTKIY